MGQNQSALGPRPMGIPGLIPSSDSSPASLRASHTAGQERGSVRAAIDNYIEVCLAGTPPDCEVPPPAPPSSGPPPPPSSSTVSASSALTNSRHLASKVPADVEVITVPEEEEVGSEGGGKNSADHAEGGDGDKASSADNSGDAAPEKNSSSSSPSATGGGAVGDGGEARNDAAASASSAASDPSPAQDGATATTKDDMPGSETGSTAPASSNNPSKFSTPSAAGAEDSYTSSNPKQIKDGLIISKAHRNSGDGATTCTSLGEGVASVQLKTIIDRVLDNSLGLGADLKTVTIEPVRNNADSLPSTDEAASAKSKDLTDSKSGSENDSKAVATANNSSGGSSGNSKGGAVSEKKEEPKTVCFMEHIVKVVEDSFSSITEEEEQREKEKSLSIHQQQQQQATGGEGSHRGSSWTPSSRGLRNSDHPTPPASAAASATSASTSGSSSAVQPPSAAVGVDGTMSVQDIVDRVISQTEMVSKLMTTSSSSAITSHADTSSKPVVAASGTFYPDRVPEEAGSHSHNQHSQRRERESSHNKEESPREPVSRRGRPRMRSPYLDHPHHQQHQHPHTHREPAHPADYHHGDSAVRAGRVGAAVGEDYLQSVHAAMKFGQAQPPPHPHPHALPPFMTAGGIATTASQGYLPGPMHNAMAAAVACLHQGRGPASQSLPSHSSSSSASSQPPPLLRVSPKMERGDRSSSLQQQQQPPHPHPPSRSCGCSACGVYYARERDAERVRMMHQQQSSGERTVGRLSSSSSSTSHSPHHPQYPKSSGSGSNSSSSQAHSQRWPGVVVDPRHPDPKHLEKGHPSHPHPPPPPHLMYPSSYPQSGRAGHDLYPAGHPAYGIQTGVPVPVPMPHQTPYDKPGVDSRHPDIHFSKQAESRGAAEYGHRHQQHPGYEKGDGRHPYPPSISAVKPVVPPTLPSHPHQSHPPSHQQSHHHLQHPLTPHHPQSHLSAAHHAPVHMPVPGRKTEEPVLDLTYNRQDNLPTVSTASTPSSAGYTDEEKPLDLSSKKLPSSSPASFSGGRQHRSDEVRQYGSSSVGMDPRATGPHPGPDRRSRDGVGGNGGGGTDRDKYTTSGSQHLHNLETSVETYFQNYKQHHGPSGGGGLHRGGGIGPSHPSQPPLPLPAPPPNISAGLPPHGASIPAGVMPPHSMSTGVVVPPHLAAGVVPHSLGPGVLNPQSIGALGGSSGSGHGGPVPLPPHHPTHHHQQQQHYQQQNRSGGVGHHHQGYPPHHPTAHHAPAIPPPSNSNNTPTPTNTNPYPSPDPLLSPGGGSGSGGRRPQLHPIPAPNLSTSLGASASSSSSSLQQRGGSSSSTSGFQSRAGVPVAPGIHPHSLTVGGSHPIHVQSSSPQASGGGSSTNGTPYGADYLRPGTSRSVSPPGGVGSEGDDRRRGSVSKHEPIQNIIGNNNPQDILYLICRLCRLTYGSPYGFRKHFRNQHGFEPKAEHTLVQTISATKARQMSGRGTPSLDPDYSPNEAYLQQQQHPGSLAPSPASGVTAHPQQSSSASPRPEMPRSVPDETLLQGPSSESPGDQGERDSGTAGFKYRNFSRSSTDSKGRSPSAGSVVDEREDTKCLECPECGQAFQLNDFGSYKRHCRQHGQVRGGNGNGGGSGGTFTCTDCQCSFPESHLLQEHLVRHQAHTATVLCTICRVPFPSPAHCQQHMRVAHNSGTTSSSSSSSSVPGELPTSSSSPLPTKAKMGALGFSHSDISSTSGVVKQEITASTASADSSVSSFNLLVTTPSDLEIRRLPADHLVTTASPDSSSDNKKGQDCSPVSSSEIKTEAVIKSEPGTLDSPKPALVSVSSDKTDSPKPPSSDSRTASPKFKVESKVKCEDDKDSGFLDGCPSNDSRSISTEDSSLASPTDVEENPDLFLYKHKKFSAHRKRTGSSDVPEATDSKRAKTVEVENNSTAVATTEQTQQNVVSSASDKAQSNSNSKKGNAASAEEKPVAPTKPSRTEARHQMPFVWDRVTRSQAGKNARSTDYS